LTSLLSKLEKAYIENSYHNSTHGADVAASLVYFVSNSSILDALTSIESLAVILSALGHDVGHPGMNNRFLVFNRDRLAIKYNDQSILENMHIAKLYKLMGETDSNVLQKIS